MSSEPRADHLSYRPEKWAARESFSYHFKSALVNTEADFVFEKQTATEAILSLRTRVRLPMHPSIQFDSKVHFVEQSEPSIASFRSVEETDRVFRRFARVQADGILVSQKTNGGDESQVVLTVPRTESVIAALMLPVLLRGHFAESTSAPAEQNILVSKRFYRARFSAIAQPPIRKSGLFGGGGRTVETDSLWFRMEVAPFAEPFSSVRWQEAKSGEFSWDQASGLLNEIRVKVPLLGAFSLTLREHHSFN